MNRFFAVAIILMLSLLPAEAQRMFKYFPTKAAMAASTTNDVNLACTITDGSGDFYYSGASSAATNTTDTINPIGGIGRWLRFSSGGGGGSVSGASNLGTGWPLFDSLSGSTLQFNSLTNDATLTSSSNANRFIFGLPNTGTAGTYTKVTFDAQGRETSGGTADLSTSDVTGTLAAGRFPALTGDVTTTAGNLATTLASVGTPGTYKSVTTDAKGRVTAGSNPTTLSGYGITDAFSYSGASVDTFANMVTLASPAGYTNIICRGRTAINDGGGGLFVYSASSGATTNFGTIFATAAGGSSRWLRVFAGPAKLSWFGTTGSALTNAWTAYNSVEVDTDCTITVASTQPRLNELTFANNARLVLSATVTLSGNISADSKQIFQYSGSGNVKFPTVGSDYVAKTRNAHVNWWGATGDNDGTDQTAFEKALQACSYGTPPILNIGQGVYELTTTVSVPTGLTIQGMGKESQISFTPAAANLTMFSVTNTGLNIKISKVNLSQTKRTAGNTETGSVAIGLGTGTRHVYLEEIDFGYFHGGGVIVTNDVLYCQFESLRFNNMSNASANGGAGTTNSFCIISQGVFGASSARNCRANSCDRFFLGTGSANLGFNGLLFDHCSIEAGGRAGITSYESQMKFENSSDVTLQECYFEANKTGTNSAVIEIVNTASTTISGGIFAADYAGTVYSDSIIRCTGTNKSVTITGTRFNNAGWRFFDVAADSSPIVYTGFGNAFDVGSNLYLTVDGVLAKCTPGKVIFNAWLRGTGSPESVVVGLPGWMYQQSDGATNTVLWFKASGTNNTGWVTFNQGIVTGVGVTNNAGVLAANLVAGSNITLTTGANGAQTIASTASGGTVGTMVSSGSWASGAVAKAADTSGTNFITSKWTLTDPTTSATLTAGADNVTYTGPSTSQTLVGLTSADTLTNKRVTQRVETLTDAATVTPASDSNDGGILTSLSQTTTFANPTGTPTNLQRYTLRIKSSTARTISWGSQFRGSLDLALPTTTSGSSLTDYLIFVWNSADSKWDIAGKNFGF